MQEGDALSIGPLAATRMASTPARMTLEQARFMALDQVRSFCRDGIDLVPFDDAGVEIASLRQRATD